MRAGTVNMLLGVRGTRVDRPLRPLEVWATVILFGAGLVIAAAVLP